HRQSAVEHLAVLVQLIPVAMDPLESIGLPVSFERGHATGDFGAVPADLDLRLRPEVGVLERGVLLLRRRADEDGRGRCQDTCRWFGETGGFGLARKERAPDRKVGWLHAAR